MLESFDDWVREAAEKILVCDDYPLIDSSEIDMAVELRRIAGRTILEDDGEGVYSTGKVERTVELLELKLIRSDFARAVRLVILNFLYRLANFEGFELEESGPLLHSVVWPHFERFVGLAVQEPGALQDPRAIRWEITNACVAYKWDLAAALFDRLKSLGAITAPQCRALKGQMYVCSVVAPRAEDESGASQGHLTWWWLPQLDNAFFSVDNIFRGIRPIGLLGWGMNLVDWVEYSPEERARLSDAAHEREIAFQTDSDLLSSYWAAWGKCYFISGDYLKASEQFKRLLVLGFGLPGLPNEAEARMRSQLYQNAAECCAKGEQVEAAAHLLESCTQEFPRTQGIWLQLAKLYLSSPLKVTPETVLNCLREEEKVDPSFGEDPRGSIALMLGEVAGSHLPSTSRKVVEASPEELRFMTSVLSRHWQSFQFLDEESRKLWVGATHWLWSGSTPPGQRALLGRRVAGYFAEIAEAQLRRFFDRFRQEQGDLVLRKIPPGLKKDKFQKYLEGSNLSLGDMISEIDGTRRLPEPQYPDLKAWLKRKARRLSNWDSKRAWRLNELRCSSSHPGSELSETDAIELYELSVWFVNQLYGD
ncbi:MAG: hypothetical protein ABSH32_35985 [Bryobacteraceae bacterium]|jgi:glutathione S-transferase